MTISSLWTSRVTPAAPSRTGDARPAHGKVLTKGMTTAETSRSPPAEPAVTKSNATPTRLPRCGAGVAAETTRRPTRASLTRNGKLATALPGRRSPLGSESAGYAVGPALGGAHHSRRTPTTTLMPLPRAPGGGPDRGPSGDGAPPKRRVSVKSSAEYVAEIVDAAPPLTDTQRSRLGALLKPTVVA